MLAKLKEAFQNQGSEASNPNFDLDAFRLKCAQTLKQAFRSMDEKSKLEFLAWLNAVRDIRASGLSYRERERQLSELRNTEAVLRTMKAVLDAAVGTAPAPEQQIIRTSLAGIGFAVSMMRSPHIPMALMLFSQALPKFLLTPQFDLIADFLEKELERNLKEIQRSSK